MGVRGASPRIRSNYTGVRMRKWWRVWAKSLGEKVGETDKQADSVAAIRTFWWIIHIVTCFFIIAHNGMNMGLWL